MFCHRLLLVVLTGQRPSHRLVNDLDAHRARRAGDLQFRAFNVDRVQVAHLHLGDLAQLLAGDFADLVLVRLGRTFSTPAALRSSAGVGGVLRMNVNELS